jgi:hypothetical protein
MDFDAEEQYRHYDEIRLPIIKEVKANLSELTAMYEADKPTNLADFPKQYFPYYTRLTYECTDKIKEIVLSRKRVCVVAAAGVAPILAILGHAEQIDSVDISLEQCAYNYVLQFLCLQLEPERFNTEIELFNDNPSTYGHPVPSPRRQLLTPLIDFLNAYAVPEELHEAALQIFLYTRFDTFHELGELTPLEVMELQRCITEQRWTITCADLIDFLTGGDAQHYDAIYTSNIYDHLAKAGVSQGNLETALEIALVSGGIANIHNMYRSDDLAHEPYPLESETWRNWGINDNEYILRGESNGRWYVLTKS